MDSKFTIDPTTLSVITLLSGLLGSILTIVLTKVLDLFQKSKEHKYSLQKVFFERKLNAAETATIQFQILANACFNLSVLFERLNNEDEDEDENFLDKHLFEQVTQQTEVANNASFLIANSVTLYFDLDNAFMHNEKIKNFYEILGQLQTVDKQSQKDYEFYESHIGSQYETQAYEIWNQSEQRLEDTLKRIADSYKTFNLEIIKVLGQMRDQMKKFDY
jgi:hypothetical protein